MARAFSFVRTHPKKLAFFTGIALFTYDYLEKKYSDEILRRALCSEVKPRGREVLPSPTAQLDRLTVILNPFSRRGEVLKQFEKNVAPILHFSGIDVQMVYPDNDFEVKDYLRTLDASKTDGVLVVGDDNVLQKAITGLLEQADAGSKSVNNLPVGIVPLGIWNTFSSSVSNSDNIIKWCFQTLQPVLTKQSKRRNVLCISEMTDSEDTSSSPRKVHAVLGLEWSVWRDAEHGGGFGAPKGKAKPADIDSHRGLLQPVSFLPPKYFFRHFGTFWRSTFYWLRSVRHRPSTDTVSISSVPAFFTQNERPAGFDQGAGRRRVKRGYLVYTPACSGCSKCWQQRQEIATTVVTLSSPPARHSLSRLFGVSRTKNPAQETSNVGGSEDLRLVVNESCQQEIRLDLDDFSGVTMALEDDHICVNLIPSAKGYLDFLHLSTSWSRSMPYSQKSSTTPLDQLTPGPNETLRFNCSSVRLYPNILKNEYFWIDNDHFEACPVDVRVRFNAVTMYSDSTDTAAT